LTPGTRRLPYYKKRHLTKWFANHRTGGAGPSTLRSEVMMAKGAQ
jgi:hypothetical protein